MVSLYIPYSLYITIYIFIKAGFLLGLSPISQWSVCESWWKLVNSQCSWHFLMVTSLFPESFLFYVWTVHLWLMNLMNSQFTLGELTVFDGWIESNKICWFADRFWWSTHHFLHIRTWILLAGSLTIFCLLNYHSLLMKSKFLLVIFSHRCCCLTQHFGLLTHHFLFFFSIFLMVKWQF